MTHNDLAHIYCHNTMGFENYIPCTLNRIPCFEFTVFFFLINGKLTWISSLRITKHTELRSIYSINSTYLHTNVTYCSLCSLTTTIAATTTKLAKSAPSEQIFVLNVLSVWNYYQVTFVMYFLVHIRSST